MCVCTPARPVSVSVTANTGNWGHGMVDVVDMHAASQSEHLGGDLLQVQQR